MLLTSKEFPSGSRPLKAYRHYLCKNRFIYLGYYWGKVLGKNVWNLWKDMLMWYRNDLHIIFSLSASPGKAFRNPLLPWTPNFITYPWALLFQQVQTRPQMVLSGVEEGVLWRVSFCLVIWLKASLFASWSTGANLGRGPGSQKGKEVGCGSGETFKGAPSPNSHLVGGFYPLLKPCDFQPFAVGRKECRMEELLNVAISISTTGLPGH